MNVETMPAGEALDLLIAQRVFGMPVPEFIGSRGFDPNQPIYGWRKCPYHTGAAEYEECDHEWTWRGETFWPAYPYSKEIGLAWSVLEAVRRRKTHDGYPFAYTIAPRGEGCEVSFFHPFCGSPADPGTFEYFKASAPDPALAICRAAALAARP